MENPKENPLNVDRLAAETNQGADDAAVLPGRLDRYSKAHHRALEMSDYAMKMADASKSPVIRDTYGKTAKNLRNCGNYLLFRDYYTVGKVRLHAAKFCHKHLLCPFCAIRRGAKMVKAYMEKLEIIKSQNPSLKAYLVTLTVKDGPDLAERFKHLHSSVQKLHKARGRERQYNESCKAAAAVWSYEFKRGKNSSDWHPHVHAVWLSDEAPDAHKLSEQWKKITRDSFIVDITPFHDQNDVINGFLEVFKYAVKFSDLPLRDNWDGYEVLAGKRLIASFGLFRGIEIPDEYNDEELDDLPYFDMLYKFIFGAGYSLIPMNDLPKTKALKRPTGSPPVKRSTASAHLQNLQRKYSK